jgi:hypothetical protein
MRETVDVELVVGWLAHGRGADLGDRVSHVLLEASGGW